jgi:hypothetical protein
MIYVGFPWQDVPEWLQLMFPTPGKEPHARVGTLRFGSVVIVWAWRGQYYMRRLIDVGAVMVVRDCDYVTIQGQHPGPVEKPVIIDCAPLIPDWLAAGVTAGVTFWLLR